MVTSTEVCKVYMRPYGTKMPRNPENVELAKNLGLGKELAVPLASLCLEKGTLCFPSHSVWCPPEPRLGRTYPVMQPCPACFLSFPSTLGCTLVLRACYEYPQMVHAEKLSQESRKWQTYSHKNRACALFSCGERKHCVRKTKDPSSLWM